MLRKNFPGRRAKKMQVALDYLTTHYKDGVLPKRFANKTPTDKAIESWNKELSSLVSLLTKSIQESGYGR